MDKYNNDEDSDDVKKRVSKKNKKEKKDNKDSEDSPKFKKGILPSSSEEEMPSPKKNKDKKKNKKDEAKPKRKKSSEENLSDYEQEKNKKKKKNQRDDEDSDQEDARRKQKKNKREDKDDEDDEDKRKKKKRDRDNEREDIEEEKIPKKRKKDDISQVNDDQSGDKKPQNEEEEAERTKENLFLSKSDTFEHLKSCKYSKGKDKKDVFELKNLLDNIIDITIMENYVYMRDNDKKQRSLNNHENDSSGVVFEENCAICMCPLYEEIFKDKEKKDGLKRFQKLKIICDIQREQFELGPRNIPCCKLSECSNHFYHKKCLSDFAKSGIIRNDRSTKFY